MTIKFCFKGLFLAFFVVLFLSCNKDSDNQTLVINKHGVFIVNEGKFKSSNSNISYYNPSISSKVINEVFTTINNRSLGDIAQSISYADSAFYIIVNNSNKIEVVDDNFLSIGVITDSIDQPRFFLGINKNKAYVSQWTSTGNGNVAVIDLKTKKVTKRIPLGIGPEKMLLYDNQAFVVNSGIIESDSVLSIIDVTTDKLVKTIKVGNNPSSLVLDKNSKIWVLCKGAMNADWSALAKPATLVQVDPVQGKVVTTLAINSTYIQPSSLNINIAKDKLIFANEGKVYEQSIDGGSATAKINRNFYNIGVNPANGDLYATDPKNYSSDGWVIRYNSSFAPVDSVKVGIIPGDIFFN